MADYRQNDWYQTQDVGKLELGKSAQEFGCKTSGMVEFRATTVHMVDSWPRRDDFLYLYHGRRIAKRLYQREQPSYRVTFTTVRIRAHPLASC